MILSDQQIEFIENSLKLYGVKSQGLREDLLDHMCSYIESKTSGDFESLYQEALQKFGGYANFQRLQLETNYQKYEKNIMVFNRLKFSVGSIASLLLVVSLLFKMMHWPYANVMMISAVLIFAFIMIPIHFYVRFKKSIHKFS
ncbi:hypothetical protein [uncultured Psychroserpens sp.]|uniref:hypothetical protein n=1 Tax=uncultured Psychroserpens sp. TaxID=255436 RepID=UPI0026106F54|nr:hypothetical protein [uncultured Psychroserpens sp.]